MTLKGVRLLLIPAVALLFLGLGANTIWDANEAFYVETPREMLEAQDFVKKHGRYEFASTAENHSRGHLERSAASSPSRFKRMPSR